MSIDLEAIEARANAATPGKWKAKTNRHPECSGEAWGWIDGPVENWCWTDRRAHSRADAEFIANAHQDIPALIAEVERLTNICKAQKASCSLVKTVEAAGLKDKVEQLTAQIASVTAERDAAVEDLRKNRARKCDCCAYAGRSERWPCVDCQSPISNYGDGWKWRGPQKGENDEG